MPLRKPFNLTVEETEINSRYAAFVDAGYFFAEASKSLTGRKERRHDVQLFEARALSAIKDVIREHLPHRELLRIYWYDGVFGGNRSDDQAAIASLDDVKVRFGGINENGEQKGVDSLIVTDLIELARLKAISDAFLLSGDEDVRIGVQIAQNYGIRVHLLGIDAGAPSRSEQLLQEVDRVLPSLTREQIGTFLRYVPKDNRRTIAEAARDFVENLTPEEQDDAHRQWSAGDYNIPELLDRRLLPHCRDRLGRFLEPEESKYMRSCFWQCLSELLAD